MPSNTCSTMCRVKVRSPIGTVASATTSAPAHANVRSTGQRRPLAATRRTAVPYATAATATATTIPTAPSSRIFARPG